MTIEYLMEECISRNWHCSVAHQRATDYSVEIYTGYKKSYKQIFYTDGHTTSEEAVKVAFKELFIKKKIYIAGKVTGVPKHKCALKFAMAQKELESKGFEAVNPLEVAGDWKTEWKPAMKKCIKALVDCDGVLVLPCAENSKGALIEKDLCTALGIPLFARAENIGKYLQ